MLRPSGEPRSGGEQDLHALTVDDLPPHVVAMVRRVKPQGCRILDGSTPVVSFGDPTRAEVATLGINPSWAEFKKDGALLTGDERRLANAPLGIEDFAASTDEQVEAIVSDCFGYFDRAGARPYWTWFRPLDKLLAYTGMGWSYYDRTACHLDLVQWATEPVWKDLSAAERATLLADGAPHLLAQLEHDNIRVVLLNGRAVLDQVRAVGLVELEPVGHLSYGHADAQLYRGVAHGVVLLGWSANIQGSPGANAHVFLQQLGAWVGAQLAMPSEEPAQEDHLVPRSELHSLPELLTVLTTWLTRSHAPTIGDVGAFAGRAWLHVRIGGRRLALNADTKRSAVEELVRLAGRDELRLRVVPNARGRINKVVLRGDGQPTPGWYCYATEPLTMTTDL